MAIKLDAGLADNVIDLPSMDGKFTVKKGAFSGKAFAFVDITSDVKVISMIPNSYKVQNHRSPPPSPLLMCNWERKISLLPSKKRYGQPIKFPCRMPNWLSLRDGA